jgi:hypothetical protein
MEELRTTSRPPTKWTWILGAIMVIAILWVVFAMIARKGGSHNDQLPRAQIRAGSMVATAAVTYPAPFSSASNAL